MNRQNLLVITRPIATTRAFAYVAAAIATAAVLSACLVGSNDPPFGPVRADGPGAPFTPAPADADYFPHRFPAPQGEIEPLPPQF